MEILLKVIITFCIILKHIKSRSLKPIPIEQLPEDFNFPIIEGSSIIKTNIFITPEDRGNDQKSNRSSYMMLLDYNGNVLWYKKGIYQNCMIHKNSKNHTRYSYGEHEKYNPKSNEFELVILNEDFNEIDRVLGIENEDIPSGYPYTHDYLYIDDGHYVLLFEFPINEKGELAIQEIKDKNVIFQWQSTESSFRKYKTTNLLDYAHPNSIAKDPSDGNFIVSCRNLGIFKINKITKEVMWMIGIIENSFNLSRYEIPKYQHSASIQHNSLVVYDNSGYNSNNSRVLRYWLDEINNELMGYKEYIYHMPRVDKLGGAQILDDKSDILGITYGGDSGEEIMYEEFDFKNNKSLFRIKFANSKASFRVWRDLDQ